MTNDHGDRAAEVKSAVEYLCLNISDIQDFLEGAGNGGPLHEALRLLRSEDADGDALRQALDALNAAVIHGGDVFGVHGGRGRGMSARSGLGARQRVDAAFRCPRRRCSRVWAVERGATAPPVCEIFGEPLSWDRR